MLTPTKDDPNRKAELARRDANPAAFGADVDQKAAARVLPAVGGLTEDKVAQTTKTK